MSTMFNIALVLCMLALTAMSARPKWNQLDGYTFEQYVKDFRKPYVAGTVEYSSRKSLFEQKLSYVKEFNAAAGNLYKKGINHLSDRSTTETLMMNGRVPDSQVSQPAPEATFSATGAQLPESIDYRNVTAIGKRVLTAVKDQGLCGSCWAHASTESVESHYAMATGELFVLSQQQLTSCVNNSEQCGGTGGCFGATAQLGWDYLVQAGGQTQEWMYGYSSYFGDSGVCNFNDNMSQFVTLSGYTAVERNSDAAVAEALVTKGPLAISVDASSWSDYESGIFHGCNYSANISMDHAVQLVGFGFDATLNQSYWLVRNSWSAGWGEEGFIRLLRQENETCGYNVDWISNGGGCQNGPNTVWACGMCGILYDTAYPNVVSSTEASSSSSSKAWIAGAVIGGVAGAAVVGFILVKLFGSKGDLGAEGTDLLNKEL